MYDGIHVDQDPETKLFRIWIHKKSDGGSDAWTEMFRNLNGDELFGVYCGLSVAESLDIPVHAGTLQKFRDEARPMVGKEW
jgi:hypothetical protein